METPIYTRLERYHSENRISFAMPGHKNMRGLDYRLDICDVTELASTLNLLGDDETTARANALLSEAYGSEYSYIISGGSTAAVKTMILSTVNPDSVIAVSHDCHLSVINTCAVAGIDIKIINEISDITDDVSAVLVTSPNYYGQTKDISAYAEKCHSIGIPLLVDEAHGAHFTGRYGLPKSAVSLGADMVCQSAHKTLNALTGGAYLHICSARIDRNRVRTMLHAVHTSSPSYMIAASADIARATLSELDYTEIITECEQFKSELMLWSDIVVLKNDDPTRMVLDFGKYDVSGFAVAERLSAEFGIDVEMADMTNIVLIVTPYNRRSDLMCLFRSLSEIVNGLGKSSGFTPMPPISRRVSPRLGMFSPTEKVCLQDAVGRTAATNVCMYPPGTALVIMGEEITQAAVDYIEELISKGAELTGITDGRIDVVI